MSRRFDNGRLFQRAVAHQVKEAFAAQAKTVDNHVENLPMTNMQSAFVLAAVRVK